MSDASFDVEIIFVSGAKTTVNVKSFSVKKNGLGDIHSIEWSNGADQILRLDIDQIAAVISR